MFDFLKYIQPGSYFNLVRNMQQVVLSYNQENINLEGYKSLNSRKQDLAYSNLKEGIIPTNSQFREQEQNLVIIDIRDNYLFLSRYFSLPQRLYVLVLRLILLKNPIYEIYCFLYSINAKRKTLKQKTYDNFKIFDSKLIINKPRVSVIIPTLNRYKYLKEVLKNLENQTYKNFEVIICDQSDNIQEEVYKNWNLDIKLIKQREKALWLARNTGIKCANGDYIALTEDDVELPTNWLENHLKCIEYFGVEISAGVFYNDSVKHQYIKFEENCFKLSFQFPTGNTLLSKRVFEKVGLFDRQFEKQRMGDGEFGLRSLLGGFNIVSNPSAYIIDLKAPTGGLRQVGSWDSWRPTKLWHPRPIPSVLYFIRTYFGQKEMMYYIIKNVSQSFIPYKYKNNIISKILIKLLFFLWLPIAIFSVSISIIKAHKKFLEGQKIESLS